jgi:hypothetical protein
LSDVAGGIIAIEGDCIDDISILRLGRWFVVESMCCGVEKKKRVLKVGSRPVCKISKSAMVN